MDRKRTQKKEDFTMQKPRYFIGIDLHKIVMQVCVLDAKSSIMEEFRLRLDGPRRAKR